MPPPPSTSNNTSNNNISTSRGIIPATPPVTDGSVTNFWRCKKCAKVNFRSATLCSQCDNPQPTDEFGNTSISSPPNGNVLSPASVGYLRSSAAVAVNAKVSNLQDMLEDQKRKYEGDIITLRKQLDHALQAHNSLLASHKQSLISNNNNNSNTSRVPTANTANNNHVESGYQQQIALLQEQLDSARSERDSALSELSQIKTQHQDLVGKCEVAATEYAAAMKQLDESEHARSVLLEKLQKPLVEPPVAGSKSIPAQSSAVLNLEREINELKNENANLRHRIDELNTTLEHAKLPAITQHGSSDTLKGGNSAAAFPSGGSSTNHDHDDLAVENLRESLFNGGDIEAALSQVNSVIAGLRKENSSLRMNNDGMKKQLDEYETDLTQLEDREKEKTLEWERERDSLKRKIAQVEKEVQEADCRERDACLTMNAMDSILSDALFSLRQADEEKQQQQASASSAGGSTKKQQFTGGFGEDNSLNGSQQP